MEKLIKEELSPDQVRKICINQMMPAVIESFNISQRLRLDLRKQLRIIEAPYELDAALDKLGWECIKRDENAYDVWWYYSHPEYSFELVMECNGFYGNFELYRSDIDD